MFKRAIFVKTISTVVLVAVAAIFIAAAKSWEGALWVYIVFSGAFFLLLAAALIRRVSFGFIFLSITLWLGFWLKLSLHMIDNTLRWMEPTGLFDFSPASWDRVALLSSLGALGVMCAGALWKGRVDDIWQPIDINVSANARLMVWAVALSVVISVVLLNEYYAINHAGLAPPVLEVPWPMQGLFNWFTGATLLILLAPYYLEMINGKSLFTPTAIVLAAGAAIAISIGSRAIVAYQSAWIVLVVLTYRDKIRWLNWRRIGALVLLCASAVAIVAVASQMRREAWRQVAVQHIAGQRAATQFVFSSQTLEYVVHLPIDRWIGLEGLMAVYSYPEKSLALLLRAINEKGVTGKADLYTSEISKSGVDDATNFAYVTLPGMFAYWYYSNSCLIMVGVTFVLVSFVILIERTVNRLTQNPLFTVSLGLTAAITINMSPGGLFIPAMMLALNVGLILALGIILRGLRS